MPDASANPSSTGKSTRDQTVPPTVRRVGCVSFLNALPLIDGLESGDDPAVRFDVPSKLLDDLETGAVDVALCPVIDLQRSRLPLEIVPVGGIGCDGPTLTVRLYSREPIDRIDEVYADTDSHTSVVLLRVLLAELHGLSPRLIPYHAREHVADHRLVTDPPAMLLIGDKVVTDAPSRDTYPFQLDLGEAWKELTGLPFVFAVWMTRRGTELSDLPTLLCDTRQHNATRIDEIVARHAPAIGWPTDLATRYLGEWLKYEITPRCLEAIELFYDKAHALGLIKERRETCVRTV